MHIKNKQSVCVFKVFCDNDDLIFHFSDEYLHQFGGKTLSQ